jgi:CheY-like chemotaxis protein
MMEVQKSVETNDETRMLSKEQVDCLIGSDASREGKDKIKILVVEDDHTTRLLYDKGLFNQIFDKQMVISGKDALQVYGEWHPDVIVLDIYLPEMTGFQVLKNIRTGIGDRQTTIVMATSLSGKEDILSCLKLGIEGYIVKPFSCGEIGAKILSYYAKKEPERAGKAASLCIEISKQAHVRLLLDKDASTIKEYTEGTGYDAPNPQTEETAAEKETAATPEKTQEA